MPDNNFPDILGYITGGGRHNDGVVQLALALRPRVIRAGRPFEVILLVQNAADVEVDVQVAVKLPDRDAANKKGQFVAKAQKLVIGLDPAEAGYVLLPINCLPGTAISSDYKVSVDVKTRIVDKKKPQRIRLPEGGGVVEIEHLADDLQADVEDLKKLNFSTEASGGFRGGGLEVQFSVMSGKVGTIADLQPGWNSLWTLKDHLDDRLLLQKYFQTLKHKVLPGLKREFTFELLQEQVKGRFAKSGYPLQETEVLFVSKLLTLILEYALPSEGEGAHGSLAAGIYNIEPLLNQARLNQPEPITLPNWCSRFLRILTRDERAAKYPAQAVAKLAFDDLLLDAMTHAFLMVETATGEDLGAADEMKTYSEQVIKMLSGESDVKMDLTHAYMPLMLGGIIVFDRVLLKNENLGDLIQDMRGIVQNRKREMTDDNEPVFKIADQLVEHALMKYGYRAN